MHQVRPLPLLVGPTLPLCQLTLSLDPLAGAVYALVTLTALSFPQTSIALIFLPFFPLPIGLATAGLLAVDLVGLFRGWRAFDHAAHLAGAASGALYWAVGHDFFERLRSAMWPQQRRLEAERRASRGHSSQ